MTTFSSGLNANIPPQQKNVTQIYLDTTLKTFTLGNHLREGEARSGILTMVEDYEHFEFVEHAPDTVDTQSARVPWAVHQHPPRQKRTLSGTNAQA